MATATTSSKSNFATAKQSLVIRPNTINLAAFLYHDFSDLKNLVKFVGTKPQIDEEGHLYFRKQLIKDNSVILRDAQGRVERVMSFDEAEAEYEIVAQSEFKPEHANVLVPKVASASTGEKGMTRDELKDALTKAKVAFKSGLTRAELQVIYDASKKATK